MNRWVLGLSYGVVVTSAVRMLALVHHVGTSVTVAVLRAAVIIVGTLLTYRIFFRGREEEPTMGWSIFAGISGGMVLGGIALAIGAMREPTDASSGLELVPFLAVGGVFLGVPLGLVAGLFFPSFAKQPAAGAAVIGGIAAGVFAMHGTVDPLGMSMMLFVAFLYAVQKSWVPAMCSGVVPVLVIVGVMQREDGPPHWDERPEPIAQGTFTHLAASSDTMCALRRDGHLVCWGSGVHLSAPGAKSKLGRVSSFAVTGGRGCAVREDKRAVCWNEWKGEPKETGPSDVVEVALRGERPILLAGDGSVWENDKRIEGLPPIAHVAASSFHVAAVARDGSGWCWGMCEPAISDSPPARFKGEGFSEVYAPYSGMTVLHHDHGSWEKFGTSGPDLSLLLHESRSPVGFAMSKSEMCTLDASHGVACTRAQKAPPNSVFAWGVLEIVGNDNGYCAATSTNQLWCWDGYDLTWSFLA